MEPNLVVSIVCPACGTELKPTDDVCHRCGAKTSVNAPVDDPQSRLIDRPWLLVVVLLHVGLLGIPLYWRTKYSAPVRLGIIVASIAYTLFVVIVTIRVLAFIVGAFQPLR